MALLEVKEVTKAFEGLVAVNHLSFEVQKGEILGIIGPNGAGKSTLFNVITGFLRPNDGEILYRGQRVTRFSTHKLASLGLVRTFQETNIFREMTVMENMAVAHQLHLKSGNWASFFHLSGARQDIQAIEKNSTAILEYLGILSLREEVAKNLSHGLQKTLEIAIALATNAELLLLDEPFTGMNPRETETMMGLIRGLRKNRGITLVVVEHNMTAIMGLSDRILAINFGRKIAEGTPEEVQNHPTVLEAYLGTEED